MEAAMIAEACGARGSGRSGEVGRAWNGSVRGAAAAGKDSPARTRFDPKSSRAAIQHSNTRAILAQV